MFDFGFSELLLIGVVALVVIGPERLPKVARTAGHLFGRVQRYVADVKADINREIHAEELRKLQDEIRAAVNSIEQSVAQEMRQGSRRQSRNRFTKLSSCPSSRQALRKPALAETSPPCRGASAATGTEPGFPAGG